MEKFSFKHLRNELFQYQLDFFRDLHNDLDGTFETAAEYRERIREEKNRFKEFDSFEDLAGVLCEHGFDRDEAFEQLLALVVEEKPKRKRK